MTIKTGERIAFPDHGVELIVTNGGDGEITVEPDPDGALQIGKRLLAPTSGVQVLVIKPGAVRVLCSGERMELQEPKATKAAD